VVSTAALILRLAPSMAPAARKTDDLATALERASANPHSFLPFSMATAKAIAESAHSIAGSPIVMVMCGHGGRLGICVSGCWQQYLYGPAPVGGPKLFAGFTLEDAQPTMGDSFITEVVGLGAFALSSALAISSFVGGNPTRSHEVVREMQGICAGTSTRFLLPYEGFRRTRDSEGARSASTSTAWRRRASLP
jgi:hypothetical protein